MSNIILYARSFYLLFLLALASVFEQGATLGITSFLIPSILMGIGVAIDVCLATIAKFKDTDLTWKSWTLPVTLTHIAFPAIGYFLFWNLATTLPFAQTFLGIIGFMLVALFIYEVLCEAIGTTPIFGISRSLGQLFGFDEADARRYVAILAVSWDALWSGPAKAAQATANNWTSAEVLLSFAIAGLVVALTAELALFVASRLRRRQPTIAQSLVRFNLIGLYLELSVIGGFGILSLWHAFSPVATLYHSIILAAVTLGFVFLVCNKSIQSTRFSEAQETIK